MSCQNRYQVFSNHHADSTVICTMMRNTPVTLQQLNKQLLTDTRQRLVFDVIGGFAIYCNGRDILGSRIEWFPNCMDLDVNAMGAKCVRCKMCGPTQDAWSVL